MKYQKNQTVYGRENRCFKEDTHLCTEENYFFIKYIVFCQFYLCIPLFLTVNTNSINSNLTVF